MLLVALNMFPVQKEGGDCVHNKEELCDKIRSIYPEIGECGIDVDITYDQGKKASVVDLKKEGRHLITYLEPQDADACMEGKQCVHLGMQISQLIK
jgi:hypothetical protein